MSPRWTTYHPQEFPVHLVRYSLPGTDAAVGALDGNSFARLPFEAMAEALRRPLSQVRATVESATWGAVPDGLALLAPIDGRTEVWASGVTYLRSREARVEESTQRSVYELVYDAVRPELFFKAPAWRVVTDGQPVAIRVDSELNVPEPELALVLNSAGETFGYLICNDMSSRSIEGENPLYLPQAKVYAGACALSVGIRPAWSFDPANRDISIVINRSGQEVFTGRTSTAQIHRPLPDLVRYLFHSENHPDGAVLSTGTGIVPSTDFTLLTGDVVRIDIDGLGSLTNTVLTGKKYFAFMTENPVSADTANAAMPTGSHR